MNNTNRLIGAMFILMGIIYLLGDHFPFGLEQVGLLVWAGGALYVGIKGFVKKPYNLVSCIFIAIGGGLVLDQIPGMTTLLKGSMVRPLFLLGLGLYFLKGRDLNVSRTKS